MASSAHIEPGVAIPLTSAIDGLETVLAGLVDMTTPHSHQAANHLIAAKVSLCNAKQALTDATADSDLLDHAVSPTIPWMAEAPPEASKRQTPSLTARGEIFVEAYKRPRRAAEIQTQYSH